MLEQPLYDEAEIVQRISEGDENAFYLFYKKYAPGLRGYLHRTTQSDTDAEEIIQSAFIRVWLSRDKLTDIKNVPAWLYTITSRLYLQQYRNKKRVQKKIEGYQSSTHSSGNVETPLDILQLEEIREDVHQVVQQMPDKRKYIYQLNRQHGKKPAEIAALLSMPLGTVKNHLTAAGKEIRDFLVAQGYLGFLMLYILVKIF